MIAILENTNENPTFVYTHVVPSVAILFYNSRDVT